MIQFGNDKIGEIYAGSDKIKEVYYGSDLVWSGFKPSFLILTDNTKIEFALDNTPINNFGTTGNNTTSLTINGQSIVKNTIKEAHLGDSYKDITSIGESFLESCINLTSVDLSGLSNLTSINRYFLYNCTGLISIDLSPLSNITSIDRHFLYGCSGLTSIDLSPLSNITSIGIYFLQNCSSLTTLIMGAKTPPTLGSGAFSNSKNLSLISVPCGSESAYKTATNWKAGIIKEDCSLAPSYIILTNGTRINFGLANTPLSNLLNDGFPTASITVNGQSVVKNTIKEVYLGNSYKGVTSIGSDFLYWCTSLTSVDLSGLSNVTSIGVTFLGYCESLTSVDLSGLRNVTSIETNFLYNCTSLTSVDLSPLSNLTTIEDYFLQACRSLTSLDLSPLSNVTSIGNSFLTACSGLTTLIMGAETPPTLGSDAFRLCNNLSLISVPCASASAYKSATNWIAKADIIQGDC